MIKIPPYILDKYLEILEESREDPEYIQELKNFLTTEKVGKQAFKKIIKFLKKKNRLPTKPKPKRITIDELKTIIPEGEEIIHVNLCVCWLEMRILGSIEKIIWTSQILITPKGIAFTSPNKSKDLPFCKNYTDWATVGLNKRGIGLGRISRIFPSNAYIKLARLPIETRKEYKERRINFFENFEPIRKARTDYIYQSYPNRKERKKFLIGRLISIS